MEHFQRTQQRRAATAAAAAAAAASPDSSSSSTASSSSATVINWAIRWRLVSLIKRDLCMQLCWCTYTLFMVYAAPLGLLGLVAYISSYEAGDVISVSSTVKR